MLQFFLGTLLSLTAIFLILLVLIQRGRGGGLAGAFGGMGGQSAFGTKAGDLFTRITIGASAFWILLCIASIKLLVPPSLVGSDAPPDRPSAQGAKEPGDKKGDSSETKDKGSDDKADTKGSGLPSAPAPTGTGTPPAPPAEVPASPPPAATDPAPAKEPSK